MRRTSALVSTYCLAIAAVSSIAGFDWARCDEAWPSLAADAENRAREWRWFWYDEKAELTHCMKQSERIPWRVEHSPRRDLSVAIPTKDGETYSFDAHWNTVFCHDEARLYYVRFSQIGPGGNVIAVDLATGKEEWKCEVGRIVHEVSFVSYASKRLIFVRDGMVFVIGNESGGRFLNIIDPSTGKLLAERRFE